jgi:hypothetical protein
MTNNVINAAAISIKGKRVLFDANIWIIINGFCGEGPGYRLNLYSDAYKQLIIRENRIVVNDYVLGEFTNRCARFEHLLAKENDPSVGSFKAYRQSAAFVPIMESVRDTCLHLLDDCEFVRVGRAELDIVKVIREFCLGKLDFSDLILTQHCIHEDLYLMTDDFDFAASGLRLITGNRKLIRAARANQ